MAGVSVDNVGLTYVNILDGVSESLNHSSKLRQKVSQEYNWTGSHLEHTLNLARSTAIGFASDGGVFPVADKQDYSKLKVGRRIVQGSIQISDAAMATAGAGKSVAMDVVESETRGLMKNILKFENFFYSRDGSGKVGTVKAATSAGSAAAVQVDDARAMWPGLVCQIYRSSSLIGTLTVTRVAQARNSSGYAVVTGDLSVTVASADVLYWNGAKDIAYSGLDLLVDDAATTFQNINVSNYPWYSSLVLDNSGTLRDLEPALFRSVLAGIAQKSGSDLPVGGLSCVSSNFMLNNMDELYESSLRLAPDSKVSGVATPSFMSSAGMIKLEADSDAPYNKIFLVDFSQITRGVQKKLAWRLQGGEIFLRSDNSAVRTATAIEICELYIKERHSSGKIEDLNESISVAY